jgi:hypothetical protein
MTARNRAYVRQSDQDRHWVIGECTLKALRAELVRSPCGHEYRVNLPFVTENIEGPDTGVRIFDHRVRPPMMQYISKPRKETTNDGFAHAGRKYDPSRLPKEGDVGNGLDFPISLPLNLCREAGFYYDALRNKIMPNKALRCQ